MNILTSARECGKLMLDRDRGVKCLIIDNETTGILSLALSMSELLEKEFYSIQQIGTSIPSTLGHLKAIYFIRPTSENFLHLAKDLSTPVFTDYTIVFTNKIPKLQLQRLARCDTHEVVRDIFEVYNDVFPISHNLFSLNIPSTASLTQDTPVWNAYEECIFNRIVEGVFSSCVLLKKRPKIRYPSNSQICRKIAIHLETLLTDEFRSVNSGSPSRGISDTTLLLVDRREDPVTPLLNQWHYQSMVHELIGIHNNRVDLSKVPDIRKDLREVILDQSLDIFYESNMHSNFGDVAAGVNDYVKEYKEESATSQNLETIEDMRKFVDEFERYKQMATSVSKHVAIIHELSRLVSQNNLLDLSSLEQDLVSSENRVDHLRLVLDKLRCPNTSNMERLRLVMLYALRYEKDVNIEDLKSELAAHLVPTDQILLVDVLLSYAGTANRLSDIFRKKDFIALAKNVVQRGLKGVDNVYTQHRPQLMTTVENLVKGKLRECLYPAVSYAAVDGILNADGGGAGLTSSSPATISDKPSNIIVFVVGGTTYEESRCMALLAKQLNCDIVLGGTTIHNSQSFLADVAQLTKRRQHSITSLFDHEAITSQIGVFSGSYR